MKQWIYRWLPTIAFIIVLPCLIALGFWQLARAHGKEAMLTALSEGAQQKPLTLTQALENPKKYHYLGIEVQGHFLPKTDVLLMHQMQGQDVGYHVLTLFQSDSNTLPVWINRGFLSVRKKDNIPSPPTQKLVIHGIIDLPKPDRFILGDNILFPEKRPLEIQRLDVGELSQVMNQPAVPMLILDETDLQDGLIRQWEIVVMPPAKHYGYAVQWFAMAACLVVIYIVVQLRGRREK